MSRAAARPPVVQRYVRRPLLWAVVVAGLSALSLLDDVRTERHLDRAFDDGFAADAAVAAGYGGGDRIPIVYDNPLTGRTATEAQRWDADPPAPRATVAVEVDRDDPRRVVLAGDRYRATPATFYLAFPLAFVVAHLVRRRWRRRLERLVTTPGPSFLMFGALAAGRGRLWRSPKLHLFPVDAAPGGPAVCSARLLWTGGLPIGGAAFEVEVKGSPRAFGRIIARVDGTVLWPRGRALGHTSSRRPAQVGAPPSVAETEAPAVPDHVPWWSAAELRVPLLVFGAAVAVASLVSLVTLRNRAATADLVRNGSRVVAQVTEDPADGVVTVRYRSPGEERSDVVGRAPIDLDERIAVGDRYPAAVDPDRPDDVRLLAIPYDAATPLLSMWLPTAAAGSMLAWRLLWRARARRAAHGSPWFAADAWIERDAHRGREARIALAPPASTSPTCTLRLPADTLSAGPSGPGGRRTSVKVAGTPAPGEPLALLVADRLVLPLSPAHTPHP